MPLRAIDPKDPEILRLEDDRDADRQRQQQSDTEHKSGRYGGRVSQVRPVQIQSAQEEAEFYRHCVPLTIGEGGARRSLNLEEFRLSGDRGNFINLELLSFSVL